MFLRNHRFLFDDAAEAYAEARPSYPLELIRELELRTRLCTSSHILEIGPGTGQLTGLLTPLGCQITAVELGKRLAEMLSQRFSNNDRVHVVHAAFEDWDCTDGTFDLVVSAQALHWIDPFLGFQKIHQLLKPSGMLAVVYNLYRGSSDAVHQAVDCAYAQHFPRPDAAGDRERLDDRVRRTVNSIRSSKRFSEPMIWQHPWVESYDTDRYLKLLDTFSDHRALADGTRRQLYAAIQAAINAHGGRINRPLMATLFLCRPV